MHRVTKRTWVPRLLVLVLVGGLCMFLWEYASNARNWVISAGSPHLYNSSNIGTGTVVDRSGAMLLSIGEKRVYSSNDNTRRSTLHWLGDRKGYINASALTAYAGEMVNYSLVGGVYGAGEGGGTAELTISARIQNAALEAMAGRKGTVGIYNYKTGEILCAFTSPTYDPDNVPDISSDKTGAYEGVYLNRFIQSSYVPGSIFKVVTTCAALECVPDIQERTFRCWGKVEYGSEAVTCETAHGTQTLKQALANSCNCAFAAVAEAVGKTQMQRYVEQFLITEPLSFDGVKTVKGNFNIENIAPVSFAWSCIGQFNDQINPARYMTFVGAIAAGGEGVEPYLVRRVSCGEKVTYEAQAKSTGRLMSQQTAETMAELMRNNTATTYGDWNFSGLNVCAKSGTGQLGGNLQPNATFTGFVQDEAYPLAFIIVVEKGGYGARTCVPILSKILPVCKAVLDNE